MMHLMVMAHRTLILMSAFSGIVGRAVGFDDV